MEPLNFRILSIDFRTPNMEPEPIQMQEFHFKAEEIAENMENARKNA
jgi:hypothetical protein